MKVLNVDLHGEDLVLRSTGFGISGSCMHETVDFLSNHKMVRSQKRMP